jgi:RNA recognition motif-containing protein
MSASLVYGLAGSFLAGQAEGRVSRMDTMLYVGNLGKTTSENELRTLFSRFGDVTSLNIMRDRISGESKQYGFLTMSAQTEADRAVSRLNNYLLGESKLKVSFTRPRVRSSVPGSLFGP